MSHFSNEKVEDGLYAPRRSFNLKPKKKNKKAEAFYKPKRCRRKKTMRHFALKLERLEKVKCPH